MPLLHGRKARTKKGMKKNFHVLKKEGYTGKQRVAIALNLAGLSKKRKKGKKK